MDRNVAQAQVVVHTPQQRPAIQVGQGHAQRDGDRLDLSRKLQCGSRSARDEPFESVAMRDVEQQPGEYRVVFDDQQHVVARCDRVPIIQGRAVQRDRWCENRDLAALGIGQRLRRANSGGAGVRQIEREAAAHAGLTGQRDRAAKQACKLAAD